ncbi:MAG: 30S ribosomal protein S17 [Chloroflexi bacterium]|nr:30S ribosomal protein S17 [Chloroflexota bacterium]
MPEKKTTTGGRRPPRTPSAAKTIAAKSTSAKAAAPRQKTTVVKATAAKTAAPSRARAAAPVAAKPVVAAKRVVRKRVSVPARPAGTTAPSAHHTRRRIKVGIVVSAKQAHTAIVEIERMREHPLYKKAIRIRKKFAAHDEAGDVRAGDLVRIQESRPFSATKRWRVIEVLSRAGEAGAAAPRVTDIEKALEESEGVTALLRAPERAAATETEPEGAAE